VRVIMTGLDWKSAFTSAVIRPCFRGMGASPKRHRWGKIFAGAADDVQRPCRVKFPNLAARITDGLRADERANEVPFLRRRVRC
jgi:hypothetical protein